MQKIKMIIAAGAALVSSPAFAANWVEVVRADDKSTILYLDMDSYQTDGNVAAGWVKYLHRDGTYFMSLMGVKCDERQYVTVKAMKYSATGRVISDFSSTLDKEWRPVVPDSMVEGLVDYVCDYE